MSTSPDPVPMPVHSGRSPVEDAGTVALSEALHSSFRIVKFLMVFLVAAFVFSCLFTVKPNEVAVILRFGRPVGVGSERLLGPGLHWAFPYPVDEVVRLPIGQSHTVVSTTGWFQTTPELEATGKTPPPQPFLRPGVDGYTLAADGNIIHARATLKYRLTPAAAVAYTFNFADPTNLLQHLLDNTLIYASTRYNADAAIYKDKTGFNDLVRSRLTHLLENIGLEVTLETCDVQTSAPLDVRAAFEEVMSAQQIASAKFSEAEAYARNNTNTALGQAEVIRSDGITHSNQLIKTVAAETKSFTEQLTNYQANPTLFRQRLLTETLGHVMTNVFEKYFMPYRAVLQLSREPLEPKATSQTPSR